MCSVIVGNGFSPDLRSKAERKLSLSQQMHKELSGRRMHNFPIHCEKIMQSLLVSWAGRQICQCMPMKVGYFIIV